MHPTTSKRIEKIKISTCPECGKQENRQPPLKLESSFRLEKLAIQQQGRVESLHRTLVKSHVPPINSPLHTHTLKRKRRIVY